MSENQAPGPDSPREAVLPRVAELGGMAAGERPRSWWSVLARCHTLALQPTPAASARSRSACRGDPALASQSQAPSSRSAPRCGPWPGCSFLAGRPPGLRSAPPGHRPQPAPSFTKLRAPPPAPGSCLTPCLRPPRCGCSRTTSAIAFVAFRSDQPLLASRSRRLRCCQGIPPIKSFGR